MADRTTWRLQISTFVGTLAWAQHYFGYLKPPDMRENPNIFGGEYGWGPDPIAVESELTEEYAKRLSTDDFKYRPGWLNSRYFSKEEVVEQAIKQFLELAKPGDILLTEYDYLTGGDKPLATKEA